MIIIGEKINGTIDDVRDAIVRRDDSFLAALASSQAEAGADCIDVNVDTGGKASEMESMEWAVGVVKEAAGRPLALDSSDPEVLQRCLKLYGGEGLFINSVTGERPRLEGVLPQVARHRCRVVALAMDESGIPETPEGRLEVCRRILAAAREFGVPVENVFLDPLALPISADWKQGRITLDTLSLIRSEFPGAKAVLGLSNVSFGLPARSLVNRSMLAAAISVGLDAVLMDPMDNGLKATIYAAEAVAGADRYCRDYVKAFRNGLLS
ncbi:MAG: dihydropteroate synthase [Actinobacteria bacterium]|nr:dihydropteroate synthase [Actinomycetota bacterium]MCG2794978.1 dihydropteroate synthase [Actinomycetes bacterium]